MSGTAHIMHAIAWHILRGFTLGLSMCVIVYGIIVFIGAAK